MGENQHQSHPRGGKFWVCVCFGLLFFCMLCYMICKLNGISEQIDDVEVCCEPFVVSEEVCHESFEVIKRDSSNQQISRIAKHQQYYCKQVVVMFKPGYNKDLSEKYLRDSLGLERVKKCPNCDAIDIELWGRDGNTPVKPEEIARLTKNKVPPESDGKGIITELNYIIESPIASKELLIVNSNAGIEGFPLRTKVNNKNKILVALIDSGVDFGKNSILKQFEWRNEPEFGAIGIDEDKNCIKDDTVGFDFVNNDAVPEDIGGHGTHIAGLIARHRKFDQSINLQIMNLKIFPNGNLFNLACALQYAITKEVDIINLSMGFYAKSPPKVLDSLLTITEARGILVITSAGNNGFDNANLDTVQHYPSDYHKGNMLSIAALLKNSSDLWEKSNYGDTLVNFATEGEDVISTYLGGKIAKLSGTSMAAGNTTGIAVSIMNKKYITSLNARDTILNVANGNKIKSTKIDQPTVGIKIDSIARLIYQ